MFEYIKGELTVKKVDYIAIDINGLAYKVYISLKTYESLGDLGSNQKVYIYTNVKEDNISFYGFKSENERELFRSLVSISGVGPKLALAILSTYNTKDVIDIVYSCQTYVTKIVKIKTLLSFWILIFLYTPVLID